jgi:hypothetical protein
LIDGNGRLVRKVALIAEQVTEPVDGRLSKQPPGALPRVVAGQQGAPDRDA